MGIILKTEEKRRVVLTAAFAPLSRARVKTSSSMDAVDELKSQGIIAIHGVVAGENKTTENTRDERLTA